MFLVSLKSLKGKLMLLIAVVIAAVVLCVVLTDKNSPDNSESSVQTDSALNYSAETHEQRMDFISQLGLKVNPEPESVGDVIIPQEFDDVYTEYNKLQKSAGLNLEPYKGCTVKKWTYNVTNYPEYENSSAIRINLLVYKGKIIGGDICSVELDGFMQGLTNS